MASASSPAGRSAPNSALLGVIGGQGRRPVSRAFRWSKLRVLIVEDSLTMRETLRTLLQRMGIAQIDMANDANSALRALTAREFDLVLCDYNLGEGPSGQSLLAKTRGDHILRPETVFIMVTGERKYTRVVQAVEFVPDGYLLKPFSADLLHDRIVREMERVEALRPVLKPLGERDLGVALRRARKLLGSQPKYKRELRRIEVDCLLELGHLDEAEQVLQEVLAPGGTSAPRWALLAQGLVQRRRGDLKRAESDLKRLMDAFPHFVTPRDVLCDMALEGNDLDASRQWAQGARDLSGTPERVRRWGELALAAGDLDVAEQAYREVIERARYSFFRDASDYAFAAIAADGAGARDRAQRYVSEGQRQLEKSQSAEILLPLTHALLVSESARSPYVNQAMEAIHALPEGRHFSWFTELTMSDELVRLQQSGAALARLAGVKARGQAIGFVAQALRSIEARAENPAERGESLFAPRAPAAARPEERDARETRAIDRNNVAVQALKAGRTAEAVQLLTQALEDAPTHAVLLANAVRAHLADYQAGGDPEALQSALDYLERAKDSGIDAREHDSLAQQLGAAREARRTPAPSRQPDDGRVGAALAQG